MLNALLSNSRNNVNSYFHNMYNNFNAKNKSFKILFRFDCYDANVATNVNTRMKNVKRS